MLAYTPNISDLLKTMQSCVVALLAGYLLAASCVQVAMSHRGGVPGFGRGRVGDQCGVAEQDQQCAGGGEVCQTLPAGNKCLPADRLRPCETDDDCTGSDTCFISGTASMGFCNGCAENANCTSGNATICFRKNQRDLYGKCVECSEDSECSSGDAQICDAPQGRLLPGGRLGGWFAGLQRGLARAARGRRRPVECNGGELLAERPTFTCISPKADGQTCHRDQECASSSCLPADPQNRPVCPRVCTAV